MNLSSGVYEGKCERDGVAVFYKGREFYVPYSSFSQRGSVPMPEVDSEDRHAGVWTRIANRDGSFIVMARHGSIRRVLDLMDRSAIASCVIPLQGLADPISPSS